MDMLPVAIDKQDLSSLVQAACCDVKLLPDAASVRVCVFSINVFISCLCVAV